ncbi:MAG: hypothetical protein AB7O65_04490 [Candidatus Korobacteraceae bacterium]
MARNLRETAAALSWSRREFLRASTGACLGSALLRSPLRAMQLPRGRKAVVVTFGGGARDDETFMPDGRENIPHLISDLLPRATFFTQVVNRGILGHYVANASLATGAYETINNFVAAPPQNPTVFEYYRKDLQRPLQDVWVVAPSIGFERIGESGHRSYGSGLGASVILPKRLLAAALPAGGRADYETLLHDNYESPLYQPEAANHEIELERLAGILKLSVADFLGGARNAQSPDELSVFVARRLMRQFAPSLLWITLHDIDIAHAGTFSLYVDGIRRTDRLCAEIWKMIESDPEYAGKTTLFILPDFGRDSDEETGGNGFQHHRTGDARSRTTWMLVVGPGIRENVIIDRPIDSMDLVPTLGAYFGFSARFAQGRPIEGLL